MIAAQPGTTVREKDLPDYRQTVVAWSDDGEPMVVGDRGHLQVVTGDVFTEPARTVVPVAGWEAHICSGAYSRESEPGIEERAEAEQWLPILAIEVSPAAAEPEEAICLYCADVFSSGDGTVCVVAPGHYMSWDAVRRAPASR